MTSRGKGVIFRGHGPRRGGRGRGSGRGRGRGHGRGSSRFGPARIFYGCRLAEKEESVKSQSESSSEREEEDDLESDLSDIEDEKQHIRPYFALLQKLNESNAPRVKRRKLEHQEPAQEASNSPPHQFQQDDGKASKDIDLVDEENDVDSNVEFDEHVPADWESDQEQACPDPFDAHFSYLSEDEIVKAVETIQQGQWTTKRVLIPPLRVALACPEFGQAFDAPAPVDHVDELRLKQKLKDKACNRIGTLPTDQKALARLLFNYRDIFYFNRTVKNSNSLRELICLHALNHVYKTRDRVIKNTYRLSKAGEEIDLELRDQGFTRPKVLFILPTRNSCACIMKTIQDLCDADQIENRKRFEEAYVEKNSSFGQGRPPDFRDLFEGNDDDMFRIGVKFTRKTIKYFSQFYTSDILLASPLGLRMAMGSEEDKKAPDYDFLSSIEMIVVDQADALLMQNWEHVEYIFEHLNKQPKDAHGCDFSRVRAWYLDDRARFFRQTVILSAFNTPELSELLRQHCHNWAGRARLQPEYAGVIQQLGIKVRQTFSRFQPGSVDQDPEARFEYFVSAIVPTLVKKAKDTMGTLLFIPSYLDFVRVRNYFASSASVSSVPFGAISEYTDVPDASRSRSHFLSGRFRVLLYTERAHHFQRYQLRGVHKVIFYGLPDNPIFYKDVAGEYLSKSEQDMKLSAGQGHVRVMFSKYDALKLERVVGSGRVAKMIQERGDTFDFI